ncbi:interleukin-10 receptor subunit beta [Chelmon rostratus]|uniref:interleukin-10 receptor subunit beta n=1 Tax=Chelmon rostratus TaxID=109905 RepID=UPI001BE9545C|nr:interleukin-10 receptor subunit beta [Chelmon rostratus]
MRRPAREKLPRKISTSTMPAAPILVFILWCLQTSAVGAELAAPQRVTMVTLNTNYTLSWDWDQSAAESHNVTFTAQYVSKYKLKSKRGPNWYMACEETSYRSCDFTKFSLHYLGIYMLRVRANLNGNHSDWVQKEFCPDKDAAVGPPSKVDLRPAGSVLDVFITDPVTSTNSSMREQLSNLYYQIVYWEGSTHTQASGAQMLSSSANLVTLPNMKAWTWYCVRVQSRCDFYNKSSSFTPPQCMQTEGATPWWLIFLYFLGSLVVCFTIVLLALFFSYRIYKTVKATFYPSNQLPLHFKEYLCDSPASDIPHLLTPDSESELLCNKVTICPVPVLEVHNPPPEALPAPPSGLEPDSSGRHSRQDSSGSGDSGVYSTGGSSGPRQPNSSQSSAGPEAPWQSTLDSEQVKMRDMVPSLKTQPLIPDEGIVDMCV